MKRRRVYILQHRELDASIYLVAPNMAAARKALGAVGGSINWIKKGSYEVRE